MNVKESFCKVYASFAHSNKLEQIIDSQLRNLMLISLINMLFFMGLGKFLFKNLPAKDSSDVGILIFILVTPIIVHLLFLRRWVKRYQKNYTKVLHKKPKAIDYKIFFIVLIIYYCLTSFISLLVRLL